MVALISTKSYFIATLLGVIAGVWLFFFLTFGIPVGLNLIENISRDNPSLSLELFWETFKFLLILLVYMIIATAPTLFVIAKQDEWYKEGKKRLFTVSLIAWGCSVLVTLIIFFIINHFYKFFPPIKAIGSV